MLLRKKFTSCTIRKKISPGCSDRNKQFFSLVLCWLQSGPIVEVLPFWQYKICLDGSGRIVLINHWHIKPNNSEIKPLIIPSATPSSQPIPNEPTSPNHNETPVSHPPTIPDRGEGGGSEIFYTSVSDELFCYELTLRYILLCVL